MNLRTFLVPTLASIMLVISSCKKSKQETVYIPPAEASVIRNLVFINQVNVEKNVSYGKSVVKTTAGVNEGDFFIRLYTEPTAPGTVSESVILYIDQSHLGSNLAKGYTFGTTEPALKRVFYSYSVNESPTSAWSSLIDSKTGLVFEGLLNITSYDAKNKLISGAYDVKARRLLNDPTVPTIAGPIDPVNQCDLKLTGYFTNVRIQ